MEILADSGSKLDWSLFPIEEPLNGTKWAFPKTKWTFLS